MTQPPDLPRALAELKPRAKAPASSSMLSSWINQTEQKVGSYGGRLGWLIASTVVVAVLQRALDVDGQPHFLLKGGTLLQHRLPAASTRATKDVDGLVRGDIDAFIHKLDDVLDEPWGPLSLRRTAVDVIETPTCVIKPRRFDIVLEIRGKTWRKIQVEIAPDEGGAGLAPEPFTPPPLAYVGLPDPEALVGLALRYQVAQKIHACSDPHDPRNVVNDRARDVVDLLLLRELHEIGADTAAVRAAVVDIFDARARDDRTLGRAVRTWPCEVVAHQHWSADCERAAADARLPLTLGQAVAELNAWLTLIDSAEPDGDEASR
ncbi:nucleotidyl transferase AbiEii/AbiGii toxin family protein [Cellulosimicrobium protaetiae]|uniref:Nucleotidyl transferase AbiEii/AbiGii toxin family protein n=1 Tax=Cellulosimicrobium protaetiae TaxID=2587808 RepID=A0A6M5UDZ0_9MICO|nr:nucleotidyl transferase AbiEii/AbiGii toxin family protein [Cellulosimicrobium protaetiae]QJW35298.1 nucleotidyl transferase AbiEii/AbiGii toxin family protein [Cellulosimicrobium protaetiae]